MAYTLSENVARRVARVVRDAERTPDSSLAPSRDAAGPRDARTAWVRVTGTTLTSSRQDGVLLNYDASAASGSRWSAGTTPVYVEPPAGLAALQTGDYLCKLIGVADDGRAVFSARTANNTGITVQDDDGSPSYTGILTLQLDADTGFSLTNPTSGTAKVVLAEASRTQVGAVGTGSQTLGGVKTFYDDVVVGGGGGMFSTTLANGPSLTLHRDTVSANDTYAKWQLEQAIGVGSYVNLHLSLWDETHGEGAIAPVNHFRWRGSHDVGGGLWFDIDPGSTRSAGAAGVSIRGTNGATGSGNFVDVDGGVVIGVSTLAATVATGGTGRTTLTAGALLAGAGTAAVALVSPPASTSALLFSAGAGVAPAFRPLSLADQPGDVLWQTWGTFK
jgi:hypothetical protein